MKRTEVNTAQHFSLVIVGGGMAAERLLRGLGASGFSESVLVISAETCAGYNRVLLPTLLAGSCIRSDLMPKRPRNKPLWYEQRLGTQVVALNVEEQTLRCTDGTQISWDKAILATGSRVATPRPLAVDCKRIQALRTLEDVASLQGLPSSVERIAVIGGGLLGLEAADALNSLGYRATVVHRNRSLMNHQLNVEASAQLLASLKALGLSFRLGVEVNEVQADTKSIASISLSDGTNLDTDLVLVATGNKPNVELAELAGLSVDHGIRVNDKLQTSVANVWALGECAQHNGEVHAFVEPVYAQADWLAGYLSGNEAAFVMPKKSARLKVAGIELFCAGSITDTEPAQSLVVRQTARGIYRRLEFLDNRLSGAVLLGDAVGAQAVLGAMDTELKEELQRENLVFGVS